MGMKGHPESNCGVGGGGFRWMRKKKMVTVTVVILVGLMAVMVVQKVKDRRLFNLVIKDKDRQILSLHLLLQKERQYAKENKRENQDLNTKLYSLVNQKIELDNKIMEMRSTIDSLRDEQRVLELEIDQKQNQIKQKEIEIKDLNSSMQTQPKIWSVSSDDPSNQEASQTIKVMNPAQKPKNEQLAGSKDHKDGAKIEMHNTNDLTTKRSKSDDQYEKSQVKANTNEIYQEGNKTRSVADRMDEDETEREADLDSSRNVSEADQDYKEETED